MKLGTIFILTVLIFGSIYSFLLIADSIGENQLDNDKYGKVICQIIDPETLKPVNEKFDVLLFDSKNNQYPNNLIKSERTDQNGRLKMELSPYIYYLQFYPILDDSKYCVSPYPFFIKKEIRPIIKIESGKITFFQKKICIGGTLKIYVADMNNIKFNPKEKFDQKFQIITIINSDNLYMDVNEGTDNLNDGELTIKKLHPGIYSIRVEFEGLGFRNVVKSNIIIDKGKITQLIININLKDNTGVEGIVTDINSIPIEDVDLTFSPIDRSKIGHGFSAITNKNGYYKLAGMPEGKYYVWYTYNCKTKENDSLSFPFGYIEIKKDILLHLDLQFKYTMDEMENR